MTAITKNQDDSCELKQSLVDRLCEAQKVLSNRTVPLDEARELISYIKKMRSLLLELHHALQCETRNGDLSDAMHLLWGRFFELTEKKDNSRAQVRQGRLDVVPNKKTA